MDHNPGISNIDSDSFSPREGSLQFKGSKSPRRGGGGGGGGGGVSKWRRMLPTSPPN